MASPVTSSVLGNWMSRPDQAVYFPGREFPILLILFKSSPGKWGYHTIENKAKNRGGVNVWRRSCFCQSFISGLFRVTTAPGVRLPELLEPGSYKGALCIIYIPR